MSWLTAWGNHEQSPNIEPWGTPWLTLLQTQSKVWTPLLILCFHSLRIRTEDIAPLKEHRCSRQARAKPTKMCFISWGLQSSRCWQLCTLEAFYPSASAGMAFQYSTRNSQRCWSGFFAFTLRSDSFQTISVGLGSDGVEARTSDTALHHSSLVQQLFHGLEVNSVMVRISATQAAAECCGSHVGEVWGTKSKPHEN